MTALDPILDLACSSIPTGFGPEIGADSRRNRCRRTATDALLATLAAPSGGLYRDAEGVWWTGDWEVRLAGPDEPGAWAVLNDLARTLGFDE